MESPGTAVAVVPPSDADIEAFEKFRKMGSVAVAHRKEVQRLQRLMDGTDWGRNLGPQARVAMAEWCRVMGADPERHVDMMGGKPFPNSNYWSDKINADPFFHHYEQRDLSRRVEQAIRDRANALRERAATVPSESARYLAQAYALDDEADELAVERTRSGAPDSAIAVTETTIWRFINAAPLDAIRSGQAIDVRAYLVPVVEYGWAGGRDAEIAAYAEASGKNKDYAAKTLRPDPIGDANPFKTADTRSLRRTSAKAFSAWMVAYQAQVERMESIIEADFTVVEETLHATGPQAVLGSGEPTAAHAEGARALPVRGEPVTKEATPEPVPEPEPAPPPPSLDDERKRFFATLRDVHGIKGNDDRKAWMVANGLGDSIKPWTREDFDRAQELIVGPIRDEVYRLCGAQSVLLSDLALTVIGKEAPDWAVDWVKLRDALTKEAEADDSGEL